MVPSESHYIDPHFSPVFCGDLSIWQRGGVGHSPKRGALCQSCPGWQQGRFRGHQGAFAYLPPHLFCTNSWLTLFDPSRAYNFRSQTARKLPFICSNLSPSSICSKLTGGRIMFTAGKGKKTRLSVWESLVSGMMH